MERGINGEENIGLIETEELEGVREGGRER